MSALLKFIQYKNLNIWSVKNYLTRLIYSNFNIVSLKECIQEENNKIKPFNFPEEDFKILGVSNKIGLFDNEIKKGKKIKQQYKKVENGFLAYNPYRINVGSIGIKTESQKYDLISPAYVVFSCKCNLLPEFLFLIFKTEIFNNTIKESTRGSVRQNLSYDILETLQIPLPSIEEQKSILDIYNKNKDLSKNQTGEVLEKSDYIEDFLKSSLGIEKIKVKKTANLLMLTRFKTLDVWSVDNIIRKNTFDSNLFKLTCLEDQPFLVKEVFRGKSPKYKEQADSKILNQKCIRFNSIEVKYAKSVDTNWLNKVDSVFLTKENDILINSTGDGTIGRASIVSKENEGLLYDSHIILLRLNSELIDPLFFVYFNNSKLGQKQIENIKSAKSTKQTELGVGNLLKLQFPLPDIDIQKEIVLKIKNLETQIEDLKIKSVKNSSSAITEFEEAIFIK